MLQMRAFLSYFMRHACALTIIFASLHAQQAHALIIGEIVVNSKLGEPLLAYVPISPETPYEKITNSCLSLIKTGDTDVQGRPNLSAARLKLEGNRRKGLRIRISTATPINVPSLTIRLKANCVPNGLVIREFFLDLEPASNPAPNPTEAMSASAERTGLSAIQKPELNGSVRVGYFSSSRKLDGEKHLGTGSLWLNATQNFGDSNSLVASGWIRNDESFKPSGRLQELQEGYLNFSTGNFDYRIGKQIIVWGRADRLNPTDNLTPRNYTLLTPEDYDQRTGTLAAKITYNLADSSLTGIWLPKMNPNVFPVAPTPGVFFTEQIPHANQFAIKFDRTGRNVDWSTSYYSGLDLNPDVVIGATTPLGTNLIFQHNSIRVLGMDATTVIGRYGLRAEGAYTWTESTGPNDFLVKKPFFYMVMGGDRTFFDYVNVNIQYFLRHVTNYSDPQEIADPFQRSVATYGAVLSNQIERFQDGISARISDEWLNETLQAEIATVAVFGPANYSIRAKMIYAFTDNIKGTSGFDIYRGDSNTFFGLWRDMSLIFGEIKYSF